MPDFDLEPGDYRERKPKGWRWRLPWSHPGDTKTPMVMFFVFVGIFVYGFINRDAPSMDRTTLAAGMAFIGFIAGGMFMLWLGRDD